MSEIFNIARIGKGVIDAAFHTLDSFGLFLESLKRIGVLRIAPVRTVFFKQIYFTGIEALSKIAILGALIGIVIITQVSNIVGMNAVLIGKILVWTVVRELGPLLAAIIITARSSTAIASELGSMKANKEMGYLLSMGIDPLDYLIVPRVLGIMVCVVILVFYFQIIAIAGGLVLSSALIDIPFLQQLSAIFSAVGLFEVVVSLFKSVIFGVIISSVSCYHGLRVKSSITEIPQVTTVAVMQSLFLIFISDGIITVASFI